MVRSLVGGRESIQEASIPMTRLSTKFMQLTPNQDVSHAGLKRAAVRARR